MAVAGREMVNNVYLWIHVHLSSLLIRTRHNSVYSFDYRNSVLLFKQMYLVFPWWKVNISMGANVSKHWSIQFQQRFTLNGKWKEKMIKRSHQSMSMMKTTKELQIPFLVLYWLLNKKIYLKVKISSLKYIILWEALLKIFPVRTFFRPTRFFELK